MQWLMLQQEKPEDFVIATGVQYSVRDFVNLAARELGITLRFEGEGADERGIVERIAGTNAPALKPGDTIVRVDPRYFRPAEVETLLGDATKARQKLGWTAEISIAEMISEMVAHDLDLAKRSMLLRQNGFQINTEPSE